MKISLVKSLAFLFLATSAYSPLKAMDESEEFTAHITAPTAALTAAEEETAEESVAVPVQTGAGVAPQTGAELVEEIENDPKLLAIHARIDEELRAAHARINEELRARRAQIEEEFLAESTRIEEEFLAESTQSRADTGAGAGVGVVDETTTDEELAARLTEVTQRLDAAVEQLAEVNQRAEAEYLVAAARLKAESAAKQMRLEAEYLAEEDARKAQAKAEYDAIDARSNAMASAILAHGDAERAWLKTESEKHDTEIARIDAELARLAEEKARAQAENLAELARVRGTGAGVEAPEQKGESITALAPTTAPAVQDPPAKKSSSS